MHSEIIHEQVAMYLPTGCHFHEARGGGGGGGGGAKAPVLLLPLLPFPTNVCYWLITTYNFTRVTG